MVNSVRLVALLAVAIFASVLSAQEEVSSGRDPRWQTRGAGALAARPATCTKNRHVWICNGAGCTTNGEYHYCTAANTWTVASGASAALGGLGVNTIGAYWTGANSVAAMGTATDGFLWNTGLVTAVMAGTAKLGFSTAGTINLALSRNAAGVLEINSGTAGKWGGLKSGVISMQSLAVPGAPTVTPTCVAGCTNTWTYVIVAKLADGTTTEVGAAGSTAAQAATLDASNYNLLTWSAVTGATSYDVRRTVSGGTPATLGLIATVTAATFTDDGDVGDGTASPTLNQTGMLKMNLATPTASTNACTAGNLWFDASFIYACTASGVIKRVAIATW